jgi:hypothetical protein
MKPEHIKLAQQILKDTVDPSILVDGDFGRLSTGAAKKYVGHIKVKDTMTAVRWIALVIQYKAAILTDAWWGPDTQDAAYRLLGQAFPRPDESPIIKPTPRCWTPSDSQMIARYGQVGTNQVTINVPFPLRLDWDLKTKVTRVTCHKDFVKPILSVFEQLTEQYSPDRISALGIDRYGGILNVRKKRGGSTWSAHAWGTAIDLWPSANQLSWKKDRAEFAKPIYEPLRKAFTNAGLMSLGTCYNFDWMHWQLNP